MLVEVLNCKVNKVHVHGWESAALHGSECQCTLDTR